MKKLLLLFSLLATITVNAQANYKATLTEFVTENNVFEVPNKTATELYELTKRWMSLNYPNPDKVMLYDEANTAIKIKYFFDIKDEKNVKVKYHLLLDFKDGKVRATFTDVAKTYQTNYPKFFDKSGNREKSKHAQKSLEILDSYVSKFIDDYIAYLIKGDKW